MFIWGPVTSSLLFDMANKQGGFKFCKKNKRIYIRDQENVKQNYIFLQLLISIWKLVGRLKKNTRKHRVLYSESCKRQ